MPLGRKQRAAGGDVQDDERAKRPSVIEQHRIARQDPMRRLAANNADARPVVEALFGEQAVPAKVVSEAFTQLARKNVTIARDILRTYAERNSEALVSGDPKVGRNLLAVVDIMWGGAGTSKGLKTFLDTLRAAAEQGQDEDGQGLRNVSATLGRGIPRLLRDRLESWAVGQNGKELAKMLAQPEASAHLRALGRAEPNSSEWRNAMVALSRLGGRAASAPALERVERAAGGSVGVETLHRAARKAKATLAHESTPLTQTPDEVVAAALRLAASK